MNVNNLVQRWFYWILFMFCFVTIPGLLIVYGFLYFSEQSRQNQLEKHSKEIRGLYQSLQAFADNESFWCSLLRVTFNREVIKPDNSIGEIFARLVETRKKLRFNYIVYSLKNGIATSSFKLENPAEWKLAMDTISKGYQFGRYDPGEEAFLVTGRLLGPQLNWMHFDNSVDVEDPHLCWTDSTYQKPLLWTNYVHGNQILIFIDPAELSSNDGIWSFLGEFSGKSDGVYRFSLAEKNGAFRHSSANPALQRQLEKAYLQNENEKLSQVVTDDLVVFPRFLNANLTIIGYIERNRLNVDLPLKTAMLAAFIFLICAFFAGLYSYNLIVLALPDELSLRWKLRFLFFFANGLPLIVLFFIGTDFLNQKRDNLLREMHGKGLSFVQDFDEKIEIEYAKLLTSKKRAQKELMQKLSHEELNNKNMGEFVDTLGNKPNWRVILVVDGSDMLGTEYGIVDDKRGIIPKEFIDGEDNGKKNRDYTRKIGQFFLNKINGTKISEKTATEIELLIESVTQRPLVNFIFDMLRNRGNFIDWGFGRNIHPAIIDTFSLENSNKADFFFIATLRRLDFQTAFLKTYIPQANRNSLGIKILAIYDKRFTVPLEAYDSLQIKEFANSLTSYPGDEIKYVNYEGEECLAMGFEGKYLKDYKLIGLFPVSRIDKIINNQRQQLTIFALLSLLVTFALSQVLTHGFLLPLRFLTAGAHAIENKNFKHRLPDLGRDEFGSMGGIFNSVMVELEELSVAGAIQEQLLPQQQIATGKFSLFGRSIAMGELGGDYYDYIQVDNNRFSVLLGDVAGHGVGAALIMAMAKAGIIQSDDLLDQPLALLNRLHALIHASKTKKQKKVMTFQYLCVDSNTGKCRYSNAGACSPMIIRKASGLVEELTLAGGALGAFKKANFSEIEISFEPGDAIVFYTDGIVEARNSSGEELGYDDIKTLLKNCWNEDAEVFYNSVFQAYMNHIGDESAQDDLTVVILVYTGKENQGAMLNNEDA
ncbi:MAG: SpoIIE family protein phosphatase [Candidatus Riflebacteria bacterium]|nr:SpoIIE family protein phosphatase [Candidatus Riflebacteria bacterium]